MKRLKVFAAALTLAVVAIGFSAFSVDSYHNKAFATRCFNFTDPTPTGDPTATEVTTSANYSENLPTGTEPSCESPRQVLCGICYAEGTGTNQYPVNASNQPDFSGSTPRSTALINEVKVQGLNSANHGVTVNGIKYFFKARP